MNNGEDILKKILLNMRYDPRKSLKENKILLNEETCVPLDAKLELYSGNHALAKGKPKSLMYPELGTWGDGTCRCRENLKCLEYNKSCCKTGVVTVGPVEYLGSIPNTFEQYTSIDGKVLSLPVNSQVIYSDDDEWWLDVPEVFDIKNPDFQPVKTACSYLQKYKLLKDYGGFTDIPSCILGYLKSMKSKSTQAGAFVVKSFKLPNGKTYAGCWELNKQNDLNVEEAPYRPHEIKFTGYIDKASSVKKGRCGTVQYTPNEYKIIEDPKAETPKFDTEKVVMGDKTVDLTKDFAIVF